MPPRYQITIKKFHRNKISRQTRMENRWERRNSEISTISNDSSINCINKQLERLKIDCFEEEDKKNQGGSNVEVLAGTVSGVIKNLNTVLVKPHSTNDLLYLDTLLYLHSNDEKTANSPTYIPMGYINDIFGSITDPLYCVNLEEYSSNLQIGAEVYYFPNHPSTQFMNVKRIQHHKRIPSDNVIVAKNLNLQANPYTLNKSFNRRFRLN